MNGLKNGQSFVLSAVSVVIFASPAWWSGITRSQ